MRSEVNFGHPKWPTAAILSKISKQMARNAIESEFRTSKIGAFNHFVKTFFLNFRIDLKWPEIPSEMEKKIGHPKWPTAAILSKMSKKKKVAHRSEMARNAIKISDIQ